MSGKERIIENEVIVQPFRMKDVLADLIQDQELTQLQINGVISGIRNNEVSDVQIAGFLVAMVKKGPTNSEVAGIAHSMRENAIPVRPKVEGSLLDTCGTGGGETTFNVSTANAIMAAAGGILVAKHGSDSISSKCGSANVLRELGVKIDLDPSQIERLIEEIGISFLYANNLHPVMGRVFGPENELGIKTIFFTIIGPLINPAGAKRHVLGVYKPELVGQVADVANKLGYEHALVVHGAGKEKGVDEISLLGKTQIAEVKDGVIEYYTVSPEDFGMQRCQLEEVAGDTPEHNAQIIRSIFSGEERGPKRDLVVLNAAGSFLVAGKVKTLQEGVEMARQVIDSGAAEEKLGEFIRASNSV